MALKEFLTTLKPKNEYLFKDIRSLATLMVEKKFGDYDSVIGLAGFIGQVSKGAKPPSPALKEGLRLAIDFSTQGHSEETRKLYRRWLERELRFAELVYFRTGKSDASISLEIMEREVAEATNIYMLLSHYDEIGFAVVFPNPVLFALERLGLVLNAEQEPRAPSIPSEPLPTVNICVPPGVGQFTWTYLLPYEQGGCTLSRDREGEDYERKVGLQQAYFEHLKLLESEGYLVVTEIAEFVCWSSLVMTNPESYDRRAFHYYVEHINGQPEFRCSIASDDLATNMYKVLYQRFAQPDDHDLRKKRIKPTTKEDFPCC